MGALEKRAGRRLTRALAVQAMLVAVPLLTVPTWAGGEPALEYEIKATFLYKFGPFVNWPQGDLSASDSPFRLCIVGDDEVASLSSEATQNQQVLGHPVKIVHLDAVTHDSGCDELYTAGSPAQTIADGLAAVKGTPTLTVTDSEHEPDAHGIIQFVIDRERVRFDVDTAAAAANGISISSKLLQLAHNVSPRP